MTSRRTFWTLLALVVVSGAIPLMLHAMSSGDAVMAESLDAGALPHRVSPVWQQALAVFSFFQIKAIYTLLSLGVIVLAWKRTEEEWAALRWGMIAFFLGENACAVNYLVFRERSLPLEFLHSHGMAVAAGFCAYTVLEVVDRRLLRLSDPDKPCALMPLCGRCVKRDAVACRVRQLFWLVLPLLVFLSMMLPTADFQRTAYTTDIFGQTYRYGHHHVYQLYENIYCSTAAAVLFVASMVFLATGAIRPAKMAMAAGLGPFVFGFLRMILGSAYDENRHWYLFWEETTELAWIGAIVVVLWLFREMLFTTARDRSTPSRQPRETGTREAPGPADVDRPAAPQ